MRGSESTTVEVKLGTLEELEQLFAYHPDPNVSPYDWVAHGFNQTLLRDLFYGAWAVLAKKDGEVWVKITSPDEDVSGYADVIPRFMDAARLAYGIYDQHRKEIDGDGLYFLVPVGMSMVRTRSIQFLHYPPYSARSFADYLYSPTNRRWESLLGLNGWPGAENALLERICDCVPLAGPGSDASNIDKFNETFMPYTRAMLQALLTATDGRTQPVVAYGSPVRAWLHDALPDQVPSVPKAMEFLQLNLMGDGSVTPLLCANHPSEFLFFKEHDEEWAVELTAADLTAARWQATMGKDPSADGATVLDEAGKYWRERPDEVKSITDAQKKEWGWTL